MKDSESDRGPGTGDSARRTSEPRRPDQRDTTLSDLVMELRRSAEHAAQPLRRPRVGFVGVEWSRNSRLRDLASGGVADIRTLTDDDPQVARDAASQIRNFAPNVRVLRGAEQLLSEPLEGLVIGGPVADRAGLAMAALDRGIAVFSHHPLAETARETAAVVDRAHRRDRLLAVDYLFRHVPGVAEMAALVRDGAVGEVFSVDLRWQSLFGSDDAGAPGSTDGASVGCLVELGSHLIDLMVHVLDEPPVRTVTGRRYASGRLLPAAQSRIPDDHTTAELVVGDDVGVRLGCSWRAAIGQEALVEASFTGTRGTLRLRNVAGMLDSFRVEHCEGSRCRTLGGTRDVWTGRMADAWVRQLARDPRFDMSAARIPLVAGIVDRIAGREAL